MLKYVDIILTDKTMDLCVSSMKLNTCRWASSEFCLSYPRDDQLKDVALLLNGFPPGKADSHA